MASSEEVSTGWVTPKDPTGETFDADALELGDTIWMRFRTDRKKLPTVWVNIHRATAEQSAGRKLSAKERKDLKEDLMQQLLPRILPSVALIDALYQPRQKKVVLFGTAVAVRDAFRKLMFDSFGVELTQADGYERAARSGLDGDLLKRLGEVSPVRWAPDSESGRDLPDPVRDSFEEPTPEPIAEPHDVAEDQDLEHKGSEEPESEVSA